jgi:hypothetical protein
MITSLFGINTIALHEPLPTFQLPSEIDANLLNTRYSG